MNPKSYTRKKTMRIIVKFKHTVFESRLRTTTEVRRSSFTDMFFFLALSLGERKTRFSFFSHVPIYHAGVKAKRDRFFKIKFVRFSIFNTIFVSVW